MPIHHVLDAFNVVAGARGDAPVTEREIERLSGEKPLDEEQEQDPTYGRTVYLRRESGPTRVTIFEGGHEMLPSAACDWLAGHVR